MEIRSGIAAAALALGCLSVAPQAMACSTEDLQSCKTCPEIAAAVRGKDPNAGDYYRGAFWNPLFAAYVRNCQSLGQTLLAAGANPSFGGQQSSMILTVSNRLPHNSETVNKQWASMLVNSGASVDVKLPYTDTTAREIVAGGEASVDYPVIWKGFLSAHPVAAGVDPQIVKYCRSVSEAAGGSYRIEETCRKQEASARSRMRNGE